MPPPSRTGFIVDSRGAFRCSGARGPSCYGLVPRRGAFLVAGDGLAVLVGLVSPRGLFWDYGGALFWCRGLIIPQVRARNVVETKQVHNRARLLFSLTANPVSQGTGHGRDWDDRGLAPVTRRPPPTPHVEAHPPDAVKLKSRGWATGGRQQRARVAQYIADRMSLPLPIRRGTMALPCPVPKLRLTFSPRWPGRWHPFTREQAR